ncbi:hypothetical protein HZS_6861, partial [Henneguya salminicola]
EITFLTKKCNNFYTDLCDAKQELLNTLSELYQNYENFQNIIKLINFEKTVLNCPEALVQPENYDFVCINIKGMKSIQGKELFEGIFILSYKFIEVIKIYSKKPHKAKQNRKYNKCSEFEMRHKLFIPSFLFKDFCFYINDKMEKIFSIEYFNDDKKIFSTVEYYLICSNDKEKLDKLIKLLNEVFKKQEKYDFENAYYLGPVKKMSLSAKIMRTIT